MPANELFDRAIRRAEELSHLVLDVYPIHKRMLRAAAFDQAVFDSKSIQDQLPDRNFFSGLGR